jgi:recombinational DNA repair protein RecT
MVMYRGYVQLADRAGKSDYVDAQVVYEGDVFEFEYGSDAKVRHVPTLNPSKRGKQIAVYALVKYKSGIVKFTVLPFDDVEKVRQCSNAKDAEAWTTWWDEMAKKTALKRLFKYERLSPEISRATYLDDSIEGGVNPNASAEDQTLAQQLEGDQQVDDLKQRLADAADASTEPETIDTTAERVDETPAADDDGVVVEESKSSETPIDHLHPGPDDEPEQPNQGNIFEPAELNANGTKSKFAEKVNALRVEFSELAESTGLQENEYTIKWRERVLHILGTEGAPSMCEADQKQKNAIVKALAAAVKRYREALDAKES